MATVNAYVFVDSLINGEVQKAGSLYDPTSLTASANVFLNNNIALSGSATTTVYAASNAATLLFLQCDVAVTYLIQGSDEASNSALVAPANFPLLLPGQTKDADATIAGRAAASTETIAAIYVTHTGSGVCRIIGYR